MALVLALYLLLCVRVTADVCAGAAKGQIVFSADVSALMFHAQVNGHIHGRKLSMRFPLPALKKKPGAKGLRKGWTMARAVLQSADWELIARTCARGWRTRAQQRCSRAAFARWRDGLLAGAGRTGCGDIHIMADFAAQDAAATARCIVSMRVGDIMLAAAKAARKKKRKEGLPWRSIPSKA